MLYSTHVKPDATFRFNFPSGHPYTHFDTFPVALITVFQVTLYTHSRPCRPHRGVAYASVEP